MPIKEVQYNNIFSPPKYRLDLSISAIDRNKINNNLIQQAMTDAKLLKYEIKFFKAVKDMQSNKQHYVFFITYQDDLYLVYTTDSRHSKFIYKYYYSPFSSCP